MRIELSTTSFGNVIILYYRYSTTHNCLLSIFWRQTLSTHRLQYYPCYHHWCLTNALPQRFRWVCNFYCNSKRLNPCLNPSEGNPTIDLTFEMGFSSRHTSSLPSTTSFPLPQLSSLFLFSTALFILCWLSMRHQQCWNSTISLLNHFTMIYLRPPHFCALPASSFYFDPFVLFPHNSLQRSVNISPYHATETT